MSLLVSVVVPTYKRPELLNRCLEALIYQDFDPADFEIIVVDDARSAQTEALVQAWADRLVHYDYWLFSKTMEADAVNGSGVGEKLKSGTEKKMVRVSPGPEVRYLAVSGAHGPAAARNMGWQAAQGVIIAFTDDDTIPDQKWLKMGVAAFVEHTAGVSGRVVMKLPIHPTDYEKDAMGLTRSKFVTANCFYKRSVLEAIGGFDTSFPSAWREDTDLYFRLLEAGAELVEERDAVVLHPIRPARWGISLSQQRKSMFNALLYKKHPRLYRDLIQPYPPVAYYLILLSALVALAGSWMGGGVLGAGSIIWLLLTLEFMQRRMKGTTLSLTHVSEMLVTSFLIPFLSVYWRLRGAVKYRAWFL